MSTSHISVPRDRRGISTILGVIIFVGLLFSSVLPMYLVMREADTIYDKEIFELGRLDDERDREKMFVYAYPATLNQYEDRLKIEVRNRCEFDIKTLRVWINDNYIVQNTMVSSMMDKDLGTFTVVLINNTYYSVKLATERGNVFTSMTGSLYFLNGYWITPEPSVCIDVQNDQGQYRIWVDNETKGFHIGTDARPFWESDGIIHYDFIQTVEVLSEPTIYKVTVKKKLSGNWYDIAGSPAYVSMDYPEGPPIAFVFTDGRQLK